MLAGGVSRTYLRGRGVVRRALGVRTDVRRAMPRQARRRIDFISDLAGQAGLAVVAHPDDDAIGVGALLNGLSRAGIVTITDGAPRNRDSLRAAGFSSGQEYARVRQREAAEAHRLLGRDLAPALNLGIPDQQAIFNVVSIARRLTRLLRAHQFNYVITHPYEGGHPDHDATALAVHAACRQLEEAGDACPALVEMSSYFAAEGETVYGGFLPHPDAGPILSFPLDEAARDLKQRMFACYASQSRALAEFPLDVERFRQAPAYDFLQPPHAGQLGYERYHWGIDGRLWREEAEWALQRLGLLVVARD